MLMLERSGAFRNVCNNSRNCWLGIARVPLSRRCEARDKQTACNHPLAASGYKQARLTSSCDAVSYAIPQGFQPLGLWVGCH